MKADQKEQKNSLSNLFSDKERKNFIKKYLIFIGILEIVILIFCWFYQLGSNEYDRFGPVDIQFPWKMYFLISFLTPVVVTFMLGIFIVAFNQYFYDNSPTNNKNFYDKNKDITNHKKSGVFDNFMNIILNIPFLLALVLLGIASGIVYNIEEIIYFLGKIGEKSAQLLTIIVSALISIASVFGLVWMILNYKLNKKSMEYQYKNQVMEKLGLIILDDKTIINKDGKLISNNKKINDDILLLPDIENKNSDQTQ